MERKTFITLSLLGTAGLYIPSILCTRTFSGEELALGYPDMLMRICTTAQVRTIGKAFQAKFPMESGKQELKGKILKDFKGSESGAAGFVASEVHRDFEEDHTIELDGWILSMTESRQCAYNYLEHA